MQRKRVLTEDPQRRKELSEQMHRMMRNIQASGGDTTFYDGNASLDDDKVVKTVKATRGYLKDNPSLAEQYPELYKRDQLSDSQSVYVEGLADIRKPSISTNPSPAGEKKGSPPADNLPTIKLGGGRSGVREALRGLFGNTGSVQPTPRLGKKHLGWSR